MQRQIFLTYTNRMTKRSQRQLTLWTVSGVFLTIASLLLLDSVLSASWLGALIGASWIATILVNSIFIDYLLRQGRDK